MEEGIGVRGMGLLIRGLFGKEAAGAWEDASPAVTAGAGEPSRARCGARSRRIPRFIACALSCLALGVLLAGCGGTAPGRPPEEAVAERALEAALEGEKVEFVSLVAPSFLEQVRAEMPESDDETLGAVLIAGFLERVPFAGVVEARYSTWESGGSVAVYVSGRFVEADGSEVVVGEADALRIPLVFEDGGWHIDLLDL